MQCPACKAVCTVLPHCVLRSRHMDPDVARQALIATHGGLSLAWGAVVCHISPMALSRLICALGQQRVVYLPNADKYRRLTRRPSQGQKGLDERALMASQ